MLFNKKFGNIEDIRTIHGSVPWIGPSGTPEGEAYREFSANPLKDSLRYISYKAGASPWLGQKMGAMSSFANSPQGKSILGLYGNEIGTGVSNSFKQSPWANVLKSYNKQEEK